MPLPSVAELATGQRRILSLDDSPKPRFRPPEGPCERARRPPSPPPHSRPSLCGCQRGGHASRILHRSGGREVPVFPHRDARRPVDVSDAHRSEAAAVGRVRVESGEREEGSHGPYARRGVPDRPGPDLPLEAGGAELAACRRGGEQRQRFDGEPVGAADGADLLGARVLPAAGVASVVDGVLT